MQWLRLDQKMRCDTFGLLELHALINSVCADEARMKAHGKFKVWRPPDLAIPHNLPLSIWPLFDRFQLSRMI